MSKPMLRPPNDALTQLMLAEHERNGGEREAPRPFVEEPPPPAPEPFRIPPPDWRAEEQEREIPADPEPAASLQARPAPKRSKPEATSTPRLDQVKAWREQDR
jgi:hypothetical protein